MDSLAPEQHYLYVIASGAAAIDPAGPVKIGISRDPDRRLRQLQTGHAEPLLVLHREALGDAQRAKAFETLIHRTLAHRRSRGEWFSLSATAAIHEIMFAVMTYDDIEELHEKVRRRLI